MRATQPPFPISPEAPTSIAGTLARPRDQNEPPTATMNRMFLQKFGEKFGTAGAVLAAAAVAASHTYAGDFMRDKPVLFHVHSLSFSSDGKAIQEHG